MGEVIGGAVAVVIVAMLVLLYLLCIAAPIAIWIYCAKMNQRIKDIAQSLAEIEKRVETMGDVPRPG